MLPRRREIALVLSGLILALFFTSLRGVIRPPRVDSPARAPAVGAWPRGQRASQAALAAQTAALVSAMHAEHAAFASKQVSEGGVRPR